MSSLNYLFLTLFLIKPSSSAQSHHLLYEVDCIFNTSAWNVVGAVHYCNITSYLIVTERQIGISAMNGQLASGKKPSDVNGFYAYYHTINFIPDFTPVTDNIVAINIYFSRLLRLRKQDLKPYGKLVYLSLAYNYLKHLQKDVFDFNPKLAYVALNNNKLTKIDPNIFRNLQSLDVLTLNGNDCLMDAGQKQLAVANWTDLIVEKCQNFPEVVMARPREEYKRNVRERTSVWKTFSVTFATFTASVLAIAVLYSLKRYFFD